MVLLLWFSSLALIFVGGYRFGLIAKNKLVIEDVCRVEFKDVPPMFDRTWIAHGSTLLNNEFIAYMIDDGDFIVAYNDKHAVLAKADIHSIRLIVYGKPKPDTTSRY